MTGDDAMSDREIDELFGYTAEQVAHFVPPAAPPTDLPGALEMAESQTLDAVQRLHKDRTRYLPFPWPSVSAIAGTMAPGELWIVAARTGNGKTTFLLDLFDRTVSLEKKRPVLFVGLEQTPGELRIKWACLRCGVPPALVLAPTDIDVRSASYQRAMDIVQADLQEQRHDRWSRAHFAATRRINKKRLADWTEWAANRGCVAVIVDHVDRMQHGNGSNSFHELSETVVLAKELAIRHELVMILASQVGRPTGDPIQRFTPPALHELRGGGTKEEEANAVLTVFRPLKPDVTELQLKKVRQGLLPEATIYEPNQMAVRVLKHRLDGTTLGRQCRLRLDHGRLLEIE